MAARNRKTWEEKLHDATPARVCELTPAMEKRWGKGPLVIPMPREVDEFMRRVPRGKVVTINAVRTALARKHKVPLACPLCTGIFAWIAAQASEEEGGKPMAYWRTLKNGGELNGKFPGGLAGVARQLRAEGHRNRRRGKRLFVADFEKSLVTLG